MDIITVPMLHLLNLLKDLVGGDYGWAIIALTVLVRLVLWPVSKSQMHSMRMMQELQPKMKMIQERYKTDPQKLQGEMFKLYKDHKFNPLGGCLPMLVQIPIFLGLFWAVSNPNFMANEDPIFLRFIHLQHTGIMSHAGPSNDGTLNVNEKRGGGLLGFGKDKLTVNPTMTMINANGTVTEQKIPNTNDKHIQFLPTEPVAGFPVKISTSYGKLGIEGLEDEVKTVKIIVTNSATHEKETVTLTAAPGKTVFRGELATKAGKNVFHMDVLILVAIFAITMLGSQKLMTAAPAAQNSGSEPQQQMMKMMPYMFAVMMFIFPIPAGVLLYMDTNSIFQIIQTWVFQRNFQAPGSGKNNPPSQTVLDIKPES